MKVSSVSSYLSVPFGKGEIEEETKTPEQVSENTESSGRKKLLLSLSVLAAASIAGIIYLRHGKVKMPNVSDGNSIVGGASEETGMRMTEEARRIYDDINRRLHPQRPYVDADLIDEMYPAAVKNPELERLNRYFERLEERSETVIEKGRKLKLQIEEALTPKADEHLDKTIDTIISQKQMQSEVRTQMTEFYTKMEEEAAEKARILAEKQAKRDAMLKLKEENPAEYARLKSERAKAKKAEKAAAKAAKLEVEDYTINGEPIKVVSEKAKDGTLIQHAYSKENGELLVKFQKGRDFTIRTTYTEGGKFSRKEQDAVVTEKFYVKNEKGKYELAQKCVTNKAEGSTTTVKRVCGGKKTNITVENEYEKTITIRDKKGNILSKEVDSNADGTPKVFAQWYIYYLKLCKLCRVSPRPCGVTGGAWDHCSELNMRVNAPEDYESYLRLRAFRASYDEGAAIKQAWDITDQLSNILK